MPFYNTTPLPVTVFTTPTGTGVNPLAILKNESPSQTLFVGLSACTPNTGVPVPPNAELRLPTATKSVYACSNWSAGTAAATAGTGVSTVGTTSWTVASGGMANIPVGTYFVIGLTTGAEVLNVATSASTTSITTTTGSPVRPCRARGPVPVRDDAGGAEGAGGHVAAACRLSGAARGVRVSRGW